MLQQVLSLAVLGLKCYSCTSSESMSDCKGRMMKADCSVIGSDFDRCVSMSVDMDTSGVKVKSYVKTCYTKALCETGNDVFKQCKQISGATCELDCCDKDGCNGDTNGGTNGGANGGTNSGTLAAVSVILMVACAFMALFR